ncbi:MAG: LamG-like jellyroll fold domain-containing protein, partial [Acidobacteriota bacterium]|nr:LamG-like jellyroll fold domain-containing protein [Acidobacteriota bacterium]
MEGKNIRIGHRSVSRLLHVSVGLLLGLSLMWTPKPLLVLARSYYSVSGSDLYKLAYPAGALTSAQADTILAELEQIGWLDEKSLRKIFVHHLSKQGIQLDYISTVEVGALRRSIDCTECSSTHNRKCVQSPFHGGKCECACYERLPNERQAGLRIAVLLLADPADRELALQALTQAGQPCVVPPAGMVAWYPLDEQTGATAVADIAPPPGSTVSDTGVPKPAPVGPVGTGPTPVAGKVGAGALYFYGPFVEVPHSADLTFPGDFSIDAWIRVVPCGGGILAPIVDKWDPATQTGFSLFVDQPSPSTGFLKFQLNNLLFTSLTSLPTGANPLANTGPWVHVAVTVNRATGIGTFYINGAQAGSFALPTSSITNTLPMLIGGIRVPGGRCEIAIDELELFTRALDQQEIQGIVAADSAGKCRPQPIERGQICVLKFEDLDGDGVQDANEPLLPGWQFTVTDANNNPVGTITTSPPGTPLACLPVTAPGTYTVTEQVQSGWMPTTPTSQTVTVQPGQTVNVAFGNKRPCDLQISKRFSPNPAPTGQPVTITLTITNVGAGTCPPGPFPGTVVSEPVFPGMPFNLPVTISQSGGNLNWQCGFTAPGDYLNCATTDPLPPGYSATFTFTATITLTPGSQIRNCATVTNQSDINSQNNVSCATLLITGCVRPPANMTAWWPLDETSGTTANDLALVANNGTHVNGPTPTPGIVAGALRFDGVNDHVRVPDHPELNVGT